MDSSALLPFPRVADGRIAPDLIEVDAAIALVAGGLARRVCLVGLARLDEVAAIGLAHAQAAGVAFRIDRAPDGAVSVTLGPRT